MIDKTDFTTVNLEAPISLDGENAVLDSQQTRKTSSVAAACLSAVGSIIGKVFSAAFSAIKNSFAALITSIFQKTYNPKSEEKTVETTEKTSQNTSSLDVSNEELQTIFWDYYIEIEDKGEEL